MKIFLIIFLITLFFPDTAAAEDYRRPLIDALYNNDFGTIDNILRSNIRTMTDSDKRLVMNFVMNYSSGDNTLRACQLMLSYDIRPSGFDLFTAVNRNRQNNVIHFLLQNGAVPNGEILLLSMARQRFDIARLFIEMGVNVNYQYPLTRINADGMTPLLYAALYENYEMVQLLVENGANINARNAEGDTALSIAGNKNNRAIYNFLLENGAVEQFNTVTQQPAAGITDMQIITFQTGSYQLTGSGRYIRFTGTSVSGTINLIDVQNTMSSNGVYRIAGNTITISVDGQTLLYRQISNESFTGNGETWIRLRN